VAEDVIEGCHNRRDEVTGDNLRIRKLEGL
jgi:hypothetical protein